MMIPFPSSLIRILKDPCGKIPSFRIMAFKVVHGTPRRVAAALITPPVFRRTRMMFTFHFCERATGSFHRIGP